MANIDLNVSPYFDDFDPSKDFLRVLFRPGFPVQARELTTLQSFMQTQVSRFGDHIFKDGSRVSEGNISVVNTSYVMFLTGSGNTSYPLANARTSSILSTIANLEGKIITNSDGSVRARVIQQPTTTLGTSNVGNLYFQYITAKQFDTDGDFIYASEADNLGTVTTELVNTYSTVGESCVAEITEGVYYVNGFFTRLPRQTVVISTTSNTPSAKLGFRAEQTVVTQNDDATLFDNARGSTNEGAPGSHRLKQNLTFAILALDAAEDDSFYRVATIENGVIVENVKGNPQYSDIGNTLARRTFDESGNYSVQPFPISISDADSDLYNVSIGKSKAYVKGFEVELFGANTLKFEKNNDFVRTTSFRIPFDNVTNFLISGTPTGTLPGQTGSDPYTYANRLLLKDSDGDTIGVARGYGVFSNALYVYDVKMFQVITTSSSITVSDGNDIKAGRNTGYVYNADGQAGVAGNSTTLINWSGRMPAAQNVSSTVASIGAGITISNSQIFELSDVVTITGAGGFSCSVSDPINLNPSLITTILPQIKTLRGTATVFDNDFTIVDDNGLSSGTANGYYNESRVDDQEEIEKNINFKYLKIKNTGSAARTGVNFGWSAQDSVISLAYPDVFKIYGINESSDASFGNGQFPRIEVNTTGLVPVGSRIVGQSSGTEAIVALQNSTVTGASDIASTTGYHSCLTGTGSTTTLEIIYQKNTEFTAGESLRVVSPAGISAYTSPITYTSATNPTGKILDALYDVDNGQRGEFYDIGRLVRKKGKQAPNGDIIIFYSYFTASPLNNFFYSADSYRKLDYYKDDVRFYEGVPQEIGYKAQNIGRDLRNSIDFRFRVEDITTSITDSPLSFKSRNYFKQARIKPDTVFTTDFDQYQSNITSISINKNSQLIVKKGQPAKFNPKKPEPTQDAMPLFYLTIPGGVRYAEEEIAVEVVDNKRYTMSDIGKIEDRVNRLEDAVSLSLLESQALHDDLQERAKSGFVVDDFSLAENNPNSSADTTHPDYNASIDVIDNHLIPAQTDGAPISMELSSSTSIDPFYYENADIVIKKYNEEMLVEQTQATGCHRINPFATWVYVGEMKLTPGEHHWRTKVNNYFTNFNGRVRPFKGDSDQFSQFLRVTTASPGGSSTSRIEWFGNRRNVLVRSTGAGRTVNTVQSRRRITTTTFGQPRAIAGRKPSETKTGSELIQNLQDYYMQNPAGGVSFKATNLRPNTEHELLMGEKVIDSSITSAADGSITGNFNIPYQTFKAGEEKVIVRDKLLSGAASSARTLFKSVGHRDFFNIIADVDNKKVSTQNLGQRVISSRFIPRPDRGGGDPIAQLFKLPSEGNPSTADILSGKDIRTQPVAIVTSIDLWLCFVDIRAVMDKILIEIRETVNGYPGGPDKVLGTTGFIQIDKSMEVQAPTSTNATNFRFEEPVYLNGDTEYAIVIKSPSDTSEVFVAELGKQLLDGSGIHEEQPNVGGYFGSFFVSQNQTTWSAEQNLDLSFKLNRANFDIDGTGLPPTSTFIQKNTLNNLKTYKADIGAFNRGLAIETFENSNYVRILHPNHGMHFNNAQVRLMGFDKFGTPNNFNGIPDSELNTAHDVLFATLDTYFVKTTTKATSSGTPPVPQFETFATQPIVYDSLVVNVPFFKGEENDEVNAFITAAKSNSLNLVVDSNKIKNDSLANVTPGIEVPIDINEYTELEDPHIVRNLLNASTNDLTLRYTLDSFNKYSSPAFRVSDSLDPVVFRNLTGTLLNDSDIEGLTTTSITSSSTDAEIQQYTSRLSAIQSEDEFSAYVTKQIDLEIPADGFTIKFDADMEPGSKLEFSYKARQKGDLTPFEELAFEDFKATNFITESNSGPFTSDTDFKEYTVSASVPYEFTSFKIRIRMITNNEAQIPRIKDLRIIADI
tara:strand:- start:37151 stop:42835 length:5685 start_codon:yes stop_codon:yes gene_type:complete